VISSAVFSRYARSLADVVLETGQEAAVDRDLATYREMFLAVPALLEALDSPAIPRDTKARILSQVMTQYPVHQTAANFLRILLEHNRIRHFHQIHDCYIKTVDERRGILSAQVTASDPLTGEQLSALRDGLARATGRSVTLSVKTDPALIGGLIVQVGSTIYDGSVRTQLAVMKQRLMS